VFQERFFWEAFNLAGQGRGKSGINPFVGAVIVKNGKIIGRGFTQESGKNHAEIEALLDAAESAGGAELYVTLEPCCHYGRTPPCTSAIIKAGIKKVYAGITDPNPQVNGKGFAALEAAGIIVEKGFWKEKIEKQLEYYLTYRRENRPFVMMKNAVTLDGKIATGTGDSKWISCPASREFSHRLRKEAGAVVTGIETVLSDDPLLNVRLGKEPQPVLRIILDSRLRIPLESKIVRTAAGIPTIIYKREDFTSAGKEKELREKGVTVLSLPALNSEYLSLKALMTDLLAKEIPVIMIEAGTRLSSSFLRAKLVDKIYYFISPIAVGGGQTVFKDLAVDTLSQAVKLKIDRIEQVGNDLLLIIYPQLK
jgi:diaminohydroxyphosphoribosylaminopyrimidine deaminase/5-amino-6-(5-phosphoribosylamino)uracil reductase